MDAYAPMLDKKTAKQNGRYPNNSPGPGSCIRLSRCPPEDVRAGQAPGLRQEDAAGRDNATQLRRSMPLW